MSSSTESSNESPPEPETSPKKSKTALIIISAIVAILLCCLVSSVIAGVYYYNNYVWEPPPVTHDDPVTDDDIIIPDITEPVTLYRVPKEVDTSSWKTYTHDQYGLTLTYPSDWTATERCEEVILTTLCTIEITDGEFVWALDFDPILAGASYSHLFEYLVSPVTREYTSVEIDGYEATFVSDYYAPSEVREAMPSYEFPQTGQIWGWTILYTDPEDAFTVGFGPGETFDEIENNRWTISYRYDSDQDDDLMDDYSTIPVQGSTRLNDMLDIMDAMSVSVDVKE